MSSNAELSKMIRGFRVADLQTLLVFAGKSKNGKKSELQFRALELLKDPSNSIQNKIRDLHLQKYNQSRSSHIEQEMYSIPPILPPIPSPIYTGTRNIRSHHQRPMRTPAMSGYLPNVNKHSLQHPSHMDRFEPLYAINPDVHFKELPFFDILDALLLPSSLITYPNDRFRETEFQFILRPQHVSKLHSGEDIQVQMRFCLLDTTSEQDDEIPPSICVKVNHHVVPLPNPIPTNKPNTDPRRPKKPIDITHLTKRSDRDANLVTISWASSSGKPYVVAINLVHKQTADVLVARLKRNGVRNPDHTTAIIKEKLSQDRDSEIASMCLRGSLLCPLGKIRMILPCRSRTCEHIQCFDATIYLRMEEKKPKWVCPVCDKPALYKNLAIDGLFLDIVSKVPRDCTEVQFLEDGSYTPILQVKKAEISEASLDNTLDISTPKQFPKPSTSSPKKSNQKRIEVISLDSDSDTEESWVQPNKKWCGRDNNTSPEVLGSPDYLSSNVKLDPYPYHPSTSKAHVSSLAPLPDDLQIDIDSSDVDCILGDGDDALDAAGPSTTFDPSLLNFSPHKDLYSETDAAVESLQESQGASQGFDLFSLIRPKQDDAARYTVREGSESPDIINID